MAALAGESAWRARAARLSSALFGLSFFVVHGWFCRRRFLFQTDRDEGYALIVARLVGQGHSLYSEVWSDQPPGYTYLVLGFTRLFGSSPETARLMTLAWVGLYLAAIYELCRRQRPGLAGHLGGITAGLCLLLTYDFVRYSSAAMIGLPSLCCAGIAWVFFANSERSTRPLPGLVAAAALLALSLSIKALSLPIVPLFFCSLGFRLWRQERSAGRNMVAFVTTFLLTWGFTHAPVLLSSGGEVVYSTHRLGGAQWFADAGPLLGFVRADAWLLIPALIFGLVLSTRRSHAGAFALGWMVLAAVALAAYSPVWSHHRYLLLLPSAALIGLGLADLVDRLQSTTNQSARWASASALVVAAVLAVSLFPSARLSKLSGYYRKLPKPSRTHRMLDKLAGLAPPQPLMVTSQPLYAYRLGWDVPPPLSIVSRKRLSSAQWGAGGLSDLVLAADPDVVTMDPIWPARARRRIRRALRYSHRRVLRGHIADEIYVRRHKARKRKQHVD